MSGLNFSIRSSSFMSPFAIAGPAFMNSLKNAFSRPACCIVGSGCEDGEFCGMWVGVRKEVLLFTLRIHIKR